MFRMTTICVHTVSFYMSNRMSSAMSYQLVSRYNVIIISVNKLCDRLKGKGKDIAASYQNHHTAMGNHMPYGITQC